MITAHAQYFDFGVQSFLVPTQKLRVKPVMALQLQKTNEISPSLEELLVRVGQHKDRVAFRALFEYFAPRVKSFLMKSGLRPDQAEELAQETMLVIWSKASSYDPAQAAASTWIFTIARNKRVDSLRKTSRPEPDPTDPTFAPAETIFEDDRLILQAQTQDLYAALKTLPQEQADLLKKSFFEDKSHADIAQEANLPLGTVKSRIRLAVEKLRQSMAQNKKVLQ